MGWRILGGVVLCRIGRSFAELGYFLGLRLGGALV